LSIYTSNATSLSQDAPTMLNLKAPVTRFELGTLFAALTICIVCAKSRKMTLGMRFAFCAFLIVLAVSPIGCGSYNTTPTPKTYSVTITGTSNQLQHSTTVSLTIQ
jgi:hypothetical protein